MRVPAPLVLFLAISSAACTPSSRAPSPARTTPAITASDVRSRIYLVADDSMRGREAGEAGNFTMTNYLAREMASVGLEPAGENGTYFQTIPMIRRYADSASSLRAQDQALVLFTDFVPVRPTASMRVGAALAGNRIPTIYGGRAGDTTVNLTPAQTAARLVILDAPLGADGAPTGVYSTAMAVAVSRFPTAVGIAMASLDMVTPASSSSLRSRGLGLSGSGMAERSRPLGLLISTRAARTIMGAELETLEPGKSGSSVDARIGFIERPVNAPARNVIALLRGSDPALRGQMVAIGAHNDHIGVAARPVEHDSLRAYNRVMQSEGAQTGARTPTPAQLSGIRNILDSLRRVRPPRMDSVANGADDDGSGSVAMLEIAESLVSRARPLRSILFVWHTGEEAGLLGSAWFNDHSTVPHDSIVAQLNMDMVGRGRASDLAKGGPRSIQAIGSRRLSTDLGDVVDSVNAIRAEPYVIDYSYDVPRHPDNRYCRSDHYMYARSGIPITYFSRGYHQDYHQVTDEAQYIDYDGLAGVAGFVRDVAVALADRRDRVRVDKPKPNPLAPCRQ